VIAGTFSEVILPPLPGAPAGRQLAVTYLSDRVRLVACVANCDGSQIAPVLNAGDFNCFINRFRAATSLPPAGQIADYANCDNSTTPPVLNAGDFACFLTKFRAGCP
jgi:hypothetical protein